MKVDELWDSMCQSAITLIQNSLPKVDSDELLLKIKGRIALFMLTMEVRVKAKILPSILISNTEMGLLSIGHDCPPPHPLREIF